MQQDTVKSIWVGLSRRVGRSVFVHGLIKYLRLTLTPYRQQSQLEDFEGFLLFSKNALRELGLILCSKWINGF